MMSMFRLFCCWIVGISICYSGAEGLFAPTYVSEWLLMDSRNTTTLDFSHDLGLVPIKVELQVRSPETGYIYPGVKSAQSDNSTSERGGVFCYFTTDKVVVYTAIDSDTSTGYVIFTGKSSWSSTNRDISFHGEVRVRAWHPDDFPPPTMTFDPFTMSVETGIKYSSLTHGLGHVPELTIVQMKFGDVHFEGLGSNNHPSDNPLNMSWGGVVYAVSNSDIRFWIPSNGTVSTTSGSYSPNGALFSFCNGWGLDATYCLAFDAEIYVWIWDGLETTTLFSYFATNALDTSDDTTEHTYAIDNPTFNVDNDIVYVTAGAVDGLNSGFYFIGTGAAMLDTDEGCGGFIYAYTQTSVHLWYPTDANSFVIKVGPGVGHEANLQFSTVANLAIKIWKGLLCIQPPDVMNTTNTTIGRRLIMYNCTPPHEHVSGDLVRMCQDDDTWSGEAPTCLEPLEESNWTCTLNYTTVIEETCSYPRCGTNTATNVTDLTPGSYVTYTCLPRHDNVGGDIRRKCEDDLTWSGSPLHCQVLCDLPETSANSEYSLSSQLLLIGTVATYVCVNGTDAPSQNPFRVCHGNGTWTGVPPTCSVSDMDIVEVLTRAEELSTNLTVPVKSTWKYKRSLVSVYDERRSNLHIGILGVTVIIVTISLLVINDAVRVVSFLFPVKKKRL